MPKLALSVIIPASNHRSIEDCLKSINEDVEIVVVLNNNPTQEIKDIVRRDRRCKTVYIQGSGCNLALVTNLGINAASYDKILIVGADCLFSPQVISAVFQALNRTDVVRTKVVFMYHGVLQYLVAECRRLFYQIFDGGTKLFTPGLAFNKSIRTRIGGYFFDEAIGWGEDGELSRRIKSSKVSFSILDQEIYHRETDPIHDLKVALKIGRGTRIEERSCLLYTSPSPRD